MYEQIAPYYDLTQAELKEDIAFVLELTQQTDGPILEVGCGSGRLLIPLIRARHQVTGIDNSPAMLARAQMRLSKEPKQIQSLATIVQGEMTGFTISGRFALATLSHNTFMHLTTPQKAQALRCIRRHLQEKGQLFIDVTNPQAIAHTPNDRMLTLERTFTDPQTSSTVVQMASNWVNPEKQILQITWLYDASPPTGGPLHRIVVQGNYHYLFLHQLEMLLRENGFKLAAAYGDYDQTAYEEESGRLLILATPS